MQKTNPNSNKECDNYSKHSSSHNKKIMREMSMETFHPRIKKNDKLVDMSFGKLQKCTV